MKEWCVLRTWILIKCFSMQRGLGTLLEGKWWSCGLGMWPNIPVFKALGQPLSSSDNLCGSFVLLLIRCCNVAISGFFLCYQYLQYQVVSTTCSLWFVPFFLTTMFCLVLDPVNVWETWSSCVLSVSVLCSSLGVNTVLCNFGKSFLRVMTVHFIACSFVNLC